MLVEEASASAKADACQSRKPAKRACRVIEAVGFQPMAFWLGKIDPGMECTRWGLASLFPGKASNVC
jgi:hypothetical protein